MTIRYVGKGGSDANNGLTWATRKLTLNGAEDTPVVAGDLVWVGAGSYRETLTLDVSGGNVITGSASVTVSVTQGSPVVIGNGTTWLSNVAPDYIFHTPVLANGIDGVTTTVTGTSHVFTSAAGNFQQGHIGNTIRINTIGAFVITAVGGATSITVAKPENTSFVMTAGTSLNYNVGPELPYDILRVDSDTQITLTKAWGAPSFTGLQFITYNPIRYVGDYLGVNTDGVGGVVRVTGSDNDQTTARANCITQSTTGRNYRKFSNIKFDVCSSHLVTTNSLTGSNWIFDKCHFSIIGFLAGIFLNNVGNTNWTVQNCYFEGGAINGAQGVYYNMGSIVDNSAHSVSNNVFVGMGAAQIRVDRMGGVVARNNVYLFSATSAIRVTTALTVGQALTINNSILAFCNIGFQATVTGEISENFNTLYGNGTDRTNVAAGANSKTFPPLFDSRWFFQTVNAGAGPYNPTQFSSPFDLAPFSQLINVTGTLPSPYDMRGTSIQNSQREWGVLEYDPTLSIKARQASSIDGGGMVV